MAQRRARPRLRFRELLALPGFLPLLLVLLLAQAVDRGFGPIIPLYIAELDPTAPVASTAGTVLSLGSFVSAVAASQVGRALRRFDAARAAGAQPADRPDLDRAAAGRRPDLAAGRAARRLRAGGRDDRDAGLRGRDAA